MEAVISANKFLDLLSCVLPAVSADETRPQICCISLEIIAKDYAVRAVATNGHILSVSQRNLGFSNNEQDDIEDIEARKKVKDATWLLNAVDVEILILSLKKLGIRRGKEDGGRYYVAIKEGDVESKKRLSISILGLSHIVSEPMLISQDFPEWKNLYPNKVTKIESISFDLKLLNLLNKCWGDEKIFMSFSDYSSVTRINRNTIEEEKIKDFILLMPLIEDKERLDSVNENQMNLI